MSSGVVSALTAESNWMSGTFWAAAGKPARKVAASSKGRKRFIGISWFSGYACELLRGRCLDGRVRRLGLAQNEFLHAPGFDFAQDDLVRIAAVHHVDDLEARCDFARPAEPADDRAVQLHLVDLAGDVPCAGRIAVRIGVGSEDILVGTLRDADGPADADIGEFADRLQIVVELLVAEIAAIRDPDMALAVDLHAVGQEEFAERLAVFFAAGFRQEPSLRAVFHDAVVAVAVGDENIALRVPTHIGRTAEDVFLVGRVRTRPRRGG